MSEIRNLFYRNANLKKNNKKIKKVILNKPEDLLKLSKEEFETINISNLCGDYYDKIYKEALEIEEKNAKMKNKKKPKEKNNNISNIKHKLINHKKNQSHQINPIKSILRNNQRERLDKRNTRSKTRSKSKEKNLLIKDHNYKFLAHQFSTNITNGINDKKHLFSPEIPPKMEFYEFQKNKGKNNNNKNKNKNNKNNNKNNNTVNLNLYQRKKIEVNLLPTFDKLKNNNQKNVVKPKINENSINDNKTIVNYYLKIKSDEIKSNIKMDIQFPINKIIFIVRYDSNYGDNIGILGSVDQLGNWSQDKILYLKWNNGNIWKGEIDFGEPNITKFEFKFINRYDGTIFWEKGFNNVVDLIALREELRHHKKGRFNKYEYSYDINKFEITLTCKINGWE